MTNETSLYWHSLISGSVNKLSDGNNDGEATSDAAADVLNINEYKACDKYDFSETDKSAVYEANALKFTSNLVSFFNKYA